MKEVVTKHDSEPVQSTYIAIDIEQKYVLTNSLRVAILRQQFRLRELNWTIDATY